MYLLLVIMCQDILLFYRFTLGEGVIIFRVGKHISVSFRGQSNDTIDLKTKLKKKKNVNHHYFKDLYNHCERFLWKNIFQDGIKKML